ncbi:hypothetical protein CAL29_28215 [Bordetella genomosp. 10]|uniref:Uncharacterized protein n=1 Tax=Bordetella genomosp. 10 TaxID=1416804 RepID=A0A261S434_9BORD|nr:hypothetical protein [Bordetella genomosp. 10]OZI31757.1 hypothetical protein CAL29_28215 [Bordetella genomosp. 10]
MNNVTIPRHPLLVALEDDAMVWLDESSQKLCQLATLFETIRDLSQCTDLSDTKRRCRIEALAELGRAVADDFAEFAGTAHDRVSAVVAGVKKGDLR